MPEFPNRDRAKISFRDRTRIPKSLQEFIIRIGKAVPFRFFEMGFKLFGFVFGLGREGGPAQKPKQKT